MTTSAVWLSQIIASCQCHSPSYIEPSEAPYIHMLCRCTLQQYHVYSLAARVTQFLCSTAHKNSPEGIHSYPTRSTHPYSSEARPHSSMRLKWAKGERLHPQHACDNCFAVFNFSQPSYLHSAPHNLTLESLGERNKRHWLQSRLQIIRNSHRCSPPLWKAAIRHPVDYSTSVQRHSWAPYCEHTEEQRCLPLSKKGAEIKVAMECACSLLYYM